jgi:hypothetical protein
LFCSHKSESRREGELFENQNKPHYAFVNSQRPKHTLTMHICTFVHSLNQNIPSVCICDLPRYNWNRPQLSTIWVTKIKIDSHYACLWNFEDEKKIALCIFELSRLKQTPLCTFVDSLDQNKPTLCIFEPTRPK